MSGATVQAGRLELMLTELRLPTINRLAHAICGQSDQKGWAGRRLPEALCEHEMAERESRRIERHHAESGLQSDKRLSSFVFAAVPAVSKAPGESHLVCGLAHALIDAGRRVLFKRCSELVQRLQAARRELRLPQELAQLDRFDLLAAVDRLVHHATILETNVASYRQREDQAGAATRAGARSAGQSPPEPQAGLGTCRRGQGAQSDPGAAEWRSYVNSAEAEKQIGKHRDHVFTFKGQPVEQLSTAAWYKALKRAGIDNFRWHDLRHTWASWHVQSGTPLHVLQELGGWASYTMVQRYAHLAADHLAPWAERLAQSRGNHGTISSQPADSPAST
jgi:hypothetical protein